MLLILNNWPEKSITLVLLRHHPEAKASNCELSHFQMFSRSRSESSLMSVTLKKELLLDDLPAATGGTELAPPANIQYVELKKLTLICRYTCIFSQHLKKRLVKFLLNEREELSLFQNNCTHLFTNHGTH